MDPPTEETPSREDRRETRTMVALGVIAAVLACTAQWWNPPLDRALERLGLLHRHRDLPHAKPHHPPTRG